MPRPFTRQQALQNQAFVAALAETGNARDAARRLGVHRATYTKRRARDPAFAAEWAAALALAAANLKKPFPFRGGVGVGTSHHPIAITLLKSGHAQIRRRRAGRLGRPAQQAFLAALSATANVRLSAAAAGFTHSAFYQLAARDPGFAREWRAALEQGYCTLELTLIAGFLPGAHRHDDWRHNDPPAIPPMTAREALQLLYLHQKQVLNVDEARATRRRRGESHEAYEGRMLALREAWYQREREKFAMAEAERAAGTWSGPKPEPLYTLPDLAQVTGWSKADPAKAPWREERALFGGWRLEDWHARASRCDPDRTG